MVATACPCPGMGLAVPVVPVAQEDRKSVEDKADSTLDHCLAAGASEAEEAAVRMHHSLVVQEEE